MRLMHCGNVNCLIYEDRKIFHDSKYSLGQWSNPAALRTFPYNYIFDSPMEFKNQIGKMMAAILDF